MKFQTLCVLGLGYIGLPTASTFAARGMRVVGVDVNPRIVDTLKSGGLHIREPGLAEVVHSAIDSGGLRIAVKPEPADAFLIAVPTPIFDDSKAADLSFVRSAAESIVPVLRKGNLVVLESTSPPRTTEDIVRPILEQSGFAAGRDFLLAYSPERVLPGRILQELTGNARVIGGIDRASAEAGRDLYAVFVQGEIVLTDATTAEFVKLIENTSRDVNIALANELSRLAERYGVNVWETIAIANRHPRVKVLQPGPGVGGHCISVDPWFLVEAAPETTPLIRTAREVNDSQPAFVLDRLTALLGGLAGKRIAALGLAYKADVDDTRESPAVEIVTCLTERGADVAAVDPYAPAIALDAGRSATVEEAAKGADCLLLLVAHADFLKLDPAALKPLMRRPLVLDCRAAWDRGAWEAAGFTYALLGDGRRKIAAGGA